MAENVYLFRTRALHQKGFCVYAEGVSEFQPRVNTLRLNWHGRRDNSERVRDPWKLANSFGVQHVHRTSLPRV